MTQSRSRGPATPRGPQARGRAMPALARNHHHRRPPRASGPTRGPLRWLTVTPQPGAPRRLRGVDAGSSRRHSPTATLRHPRLTLCRAKVTCPLVSSAPRPPDGRSSQAGRQRGSDSTCVPEASFPAPPHWIRSRWTQEAVKPQEADPMDGPAGRAGVSAVPGPPPRYPTH